MKVILAAVLAALLAGSAIAGQDGASPSDAAEAARLNSEVVKLFGQGKYDEALPLARKSVELRERAHGADHPTVAASLTNLAAVLTEKKDFDEAEKLYLRALAVADKHGASQRGLAAEINTRLALLRFRAEDYEQAERFNLRALELREQAGAAPASNPIPNLLNLIEVQLMRREFDKAGGYLDRLNAFLRSRPPSQDTSAADRMKSYLCPLLGAKEDELAKKVNQAMTWLRNPEKAAEWEKSAAAGDTKKALVEGGVLTGRVASTVAPAYPANAMAHRASGTVVVGITVSEEGRVLDAEAICGHRMLTEAAVEAVRGWRFTPTLLNGQPVKVTGTVTVNFVLQR